MLLVERTEAMIGRVKIAVAVAAGLLFSLPAARAANLMTPGQFLIVPNGGSGAGTFTAHDVLIGEGTSAFAAVSPGTTSGVPLISQGTSADPIFGTVVVAGGGTGLATLTAHALIIGEGTSNVAFAAAAADSIPLWQSSGVDPTVTAINNCATALTYATSTHTFGCNASAGVVPTEATATGASPITITATNLLTTIVSMATPAASTINLPTAVQTAGWRECVKDGTTNFATNNATLKSPTAGTIDGISGSTGVVLNQKGQELCVMSDATNWWTE
jgi:hypothetical protein